MKKPVGAIVIFISAIAVVAFAYRTLTGREDEVDSAAGDGSPSIQPAADNAANIDENLSELISTTEVDSVAVDITQASTGTEQLSAETEEIQRVSNQPNLEEYFERLIAEPVDPAWAPSIRSQIESALRSTPITFQDIETVCKTTICRAVLKHDFGVSAGESANQQDFSQYGRLLSQVIEQDLRLNTFLTSTFPENGVDLAVESSSWGNLITTIYLFEQEQAETN